MKKRWIRAALPLLLVLALLAAPASALTVEQTRQLLEEYYVDPVDESILSLPTTQQMLDALGDPYTEYLTAEEYRDFLDSMSDTSLVGIGVSVPAQLTAQDPFTLLEVFEGGPADTGGLVPGDVIVAVDHVDVQGMEPDEIIARIRGQEGSAVSITYLRDGLRRTVTLQRETVYVPATTGKLLEGGVCYIQCTTWGEETLGHFHQIMGKYAKEAQCWVIDLRNNPGGLTDAAADVAGLFCGAGDMLYLRARTQDPDSPDGYSYDFYTSRSVPATTKPVVVLVNEYSASSSEAFAAALRDYGVGVIVGSRTYGKGVAQGVFDESVYPEYFDGDCLKLTIARFYSPAGSTSDTLGVIPDFWVEDPVSAENLAFNLAAAFAQDPDTWRQTRNKVAALFVADAQFGDALDDSYESRAINILHAYGLVSGKDDGLFHASDTLTRAELAQMLANALRCVVPEDGAAFADVAADAWYSGAVAAMAAQGMMEGTGEDRFSPDRVLTRQELFTVLGRLGRWLNDDLDLAVRQAEPSDWDLRVLSDYAPWARPSVWLLSCALEDQSGTVNLLWDDPEAIDPTAPATRGEAAQVLYSMLSDLAILN